MNGDVQFADDFDGDLLDHIVDRWCRLRAEYRLDTDALSLRMDLLAANGVNGNAGLDLEKLAAFDDSNFIHDVAGISKYMNRYSGKLGGCFLPRCALPDSTGY